MLLSIVGLSLVMYYFFDNNLANLVVDGQLQIIKIVQLLVMAIGLRRYDHRYCRHAEDVRKVRQEAAL